MTVINTYAHKIADFVKGPGVKDEGGALFSMAESGVDNEGRSAYTWLKSVIKGIKIIDLGILGFDSPIKLTPDGRAGLLQLTKEENDDIEAESDEIEHARPWHNYFEFEGDPGALKVFATAVDRSNTTRDVALGGAIADLSILQSASPDPISPGSTITYNITVTNDGPASASSVKVTDLLPASIMLLSCSASDGGTCDGAGNITFSSLSANTTATIVIKAIVSCPPDGVLTITNMVNVNSATFELTPDDNRAVLTTTITGDSELEINMRFQQSGPVAARNKFKPKKSKLGVLTIENPGCAALTFKLESIKRSETDVSEGKIGDPDDRALFPINVINDGRETPIMVGGPSAQFTIAGNRGPIEFPVLFHPKIPAFRNQSSGLPSTFILPCRFASILSISDSRGVLRAITLPGVIKPAVTLIEPVRLFRSGDEFSVEFTVYDCDPRDVRSVKYEFFDQNNVMIGSPITLEDELRNAIEREINEDRLQPGQSFRGTKTFLSVKNSGDVTVRVTVNGLGGSSDTATAGAQGSSANSSAIRSLHTQGASVFLPSAKLMSNKTGSAKKLPKRKER